MIVAATNFCAKNGRRLNLLGVPKCSDKSAIASQCHCQQVCIKAFTTWQQIFLADVVNTTSPGKWQQRRSIFGVNFDDLLVASKFPQVRIDRYIVIK